MYKTINLWLLLLTIVNMTICVSHDNVSNANVAEIMSQSLVVATASTRNLSTVMENSESKVATSGGELCNQKKGKKEPKRCEGRSLAPLKLLLLCVSA